MNNQPTQHPELPLACESTPAPQSADAGLIAPPLQNEGRPPTRSLSHLPTFPFPHCPGETARAYSAFIAYFQLGHARNLQAVADQLGEILSTVKKWSTRFAWADRIRAFNAGLLQQQAEARAAVQRQHAADWAKRDNELREQEWGTAQKLLGAAQCFLENFGDEELQKMNLAQVSRALNVSSQIGRLALAGAGLPEKIEPAMSPIQIQLTEALNRMYGPKTPTPSDTTQNPNDKI